MIGKLNLSSGGNKIAPRNVSNLDIKVGNGKVEILWSDPQDTVVDEQKICTWKGTKLVYKTGSYPQNIKDGVLLVDNKERDKYKTNGFEVNNLENGETYFFSLFPYSDKNAVNTNVSNRISGTIKNYKIMTAIIDLSNGDPETSVTYADDAIGMTAGSSEWDEFFGHYPCLFKNGQEVGKLNPNDFNKFEDGSLADITSGEAGDVMIAFPRRGLKIETVENKVIVSMTDGENVSGFEYNAHCRGIVDKDIFYLGAYKGYVENSKLRSLSQKKVSVSETIGTFRMQAQTNGSGYEQSGFYQLTFRQAMYVLKYKNLNSQEIIGKGFVSESSEAILTGETEEWGMDGQIIKQTNPTYISDGEHHVKLFGIEDFWGNVHEWIDGLLTDASGNIMTTTQNFNNAGTGYINQGQVTSENEIRGYMSKPQGEIHTGFIAKELDGSEKTYFCDFVELDASGFAYFGYSFSRTAWDPSYSGGVFSLNIYRSESFTSKMYGARLMYL